MSQDLFNAILLKKLESELLADVLPPSWEKYEVEHRMSACDHALDLSRAGFYFRDAPVTPAH